MLLKTTFKPIDRMFEFISQILIKVIIFFFSKRSEPAVDFCNPPENSEIHKTSSIKSHIGKLKRQIETDF